MIQSRPLAIRILAETNITSSQRTDVLLVLAGALFTAVMAQIAIPLPFSPVPITGQSFAVLLIGASFGANRAMLSMLLYLTMGAMGLPFFAGAMGGLSFFTGATAGYLFGFLLAAWIMGYFADSKAYATHFRTALPLFLLGHMIIFACGLCWFTVLVGFKTAIVQGLLPFIPGAIVKTILASALLPELSKRYQ